VPSTEAKAAQISFNGELIRKTIHLGSLSIPVVYNMIPKKTALFILVPILIFSLFIDIGRYYLPGLRKIVDKVFDPILRPHERVSKTILLSGATYVLISAVICVIAFPKMITVTAFAILIMSDASSALIGRAFGKHRFLDKSLEGSLAFVVSAWIVLVFTPKAGPLPIEFVIGAIAAIVGAVMEASSVTLHFDDNLSVPLSVGATMWLLYYLLSLYDPAAYQALYTAMLAYT
jgi:dolichol kinase